ncbi:hypothetical protein ACE6H2_025896 [Prunus campanulata]
MQNNEVIWQVITDNLSGTNTAASCPKLKLGYSVETHITSQIFFFHLSHLFFMCSVLGGEVFAECEKEIGALAKRLLGLISQGLGPEEDCLQKKLGENPTQKAEGNYYPPCPDPELTLGLSVHTDLNALTILRQTEGVTGLQVLSNGRYKSVHHRAVANKVEPRLSLAMFYGPSRDTVIGPIEDLIDEEHPPLYRSYKDAEIFLKNSTSKKEKEDW